MKTILLSFQPQWFQELETGKMKFEYRMVLPKEETTAFFYVSNPVMCISGKAHLGAREDLKDWLQIYGNRSIEVKNRINSYLEDCRYAAKIHEFQQTNSIPLDKLRTDIPGFMPPRMYYYIDNTDLLAYLNTNIVPSGNHWSFSFNSIIDDDICN